MTSDALRFDSRMNSLFFVQILERLVASLVAAPCSMVLVGNIVNFSYAPGDELVVGRSVR